MNWRRGFAHQQMWGKVYDLLRAELPEVPSPVVARMTSAAVEQAGYQNPMGEVRHVR